MKKSARIQPVLGIAEREEKKATDAFLRVQQNATQARQKLQELRDYRAEYQQRSNLDASGGQDLLDLRQLQDNRAFLAKLNDVIAIQQSIVEQCDAQLDTARDHWLSKRQKTHSLGRLAGEYRHQEHRAAQILEQKQSDELNVLRHSWQLRQRHEEIC
ncbi:flagellar export protein FliJ [Litorivivens sp.]|uniref:flagellar export protein FliJ n=1 Tax=Litorivivens sp. TaxID=2020868 RepID=UPI00356A9A2D